jgi:hypothetical protein
VLELELSVDINESHALVLESLEKGLEPPFFFEKANQPYERVVFS